MKIQFKVQDYQTDAVRAVVDCFAGQPLIATPKYAIDPGVDKKRIKPVGQLTQQDLLDSLELEGFRNADLRLTIAQLLANIQQIQLEQSIPQSLSLVPSQSCKLNLDIEMETGTGKTYRWRKGRKVPGTDGTQLICDLLQSVY